MSKILKKEVVDFKRYLNGYEFTTTLPGSGKSVTFKPVTTLAMKKLLSSWNDNDVSVENALDNLITDCITDVDFSIDDLYIADRLYLLIEIRKKSKGSFIEFTYDCKKCESQSIQKIDLNKLNVKKLDLSKGRDIVKLDENISVRLTPLTRRIQKKAADKIKDINDADKNIERVIVTYAFCIKEIMLPEGSIKDPPFEDAYEFVKNCYDFMFNKIRDWFDNYDFGIDLEYEIKCPHCNLEDKIEVPIENFFY